LSSARHSGKICARRGQDVEFETQLETDRDRGQGVESIEAPGLWQQNTAEPSIFPEDRKLGATSLPRCDLEPHFGLFRDSVADDPPPQVITEAPGARVVGADYCRSEDRSPIGEGGEGRP
jgi:hypothetical protein